VFLSACANPQMMKYDSITKKDIPLMERIYPAPEKYLEMGGYKMCYVEAGEGFPLVILPGVSLTAHNWRYNFPRYSKKFKVYCIDFPGYGKSDTPDADYSIDFFTAAVKKFMDEKGLKKVFLLGHSLGGQVAIDFTHKYPDRVEKLVLETATGIRTRYGILEDLMIPWFVTEDRFANAPFHSLREYTEVNFYNMCDACEELFYYQVAYRLHMKGTEEFEKRNRAFVRGVRNIILTSVRDKATKITVPTLIMWGRNDQLDDVKNAYFLNSQMPNARLFVIEQCGHQPHLERPEIYDEAVIDFLTYKEPEPKRKPVTTKAFIFQ
jgi:pimeloyl-ACP methyl ester carboxylesterase